MVAMQCKGPMLGRSVHDTAVDSTAVLQLLCHSTAACMLLPSALLSYMQERTEKLLLPQEFQAIAAVFTASDAPPSGSGTFSAQPLSHLGIVMGFCQSSHTMLSQQLT